MMDEQIWKCLGFFFLFYTENDGDYMSWPWEETYAAACINCKIISSQGSDFSPLSILSAKHDLAGFGNGVRGRVNLILSTKKKKKTQVSVRPPSPGTPGRDTTSGNTVGTLSFQVWVGSSGSLNIFPRWIPLPKGRCEPDWAATSLELSDVPKDVWDEPITSSVHPRPMSRCLSFLHRVWCFLNGSRGWKCCLFKLTAWSCLVSSFMSHSCWLAGHDLLFLSVKTQNCTRPH